MPDGCLIRVCFKTTATTRLGRFAGTWSVHTSPAITPCGRWLAGSEVNQDRQPGKRAARATEGEGARPGVLDVAGRGVTNAVDGAVEQLVTVAAPGPGQVREPTELREELGEVTAGHPPIVRARPAPRRGDTRPSRRSAASWQTRWA